MDIKARFGARLKELRQAKGISQEALANLCGLDRTYMTSVENGRRNLSIESIEKILSGLGISFGEFFSTF
jgi:transcriptional regulator with XRE-family HTH domain